MCSIKLLYYGLLIVAVTRLTWAQQKANQKCDNYMKGARSLSGNRRRSIPNAHHIVGGIESDDDEFPHMVALGYGKFPNYQWNCGGTLISEQFVLTAAHCVEHRQLGVVKVAKMGTRRLMDHTSGKTIEIAATFQHPQYIPPSHYNDIALVKLKSAVKFSKAILPACLNTAFDVRPRTSKLIATGWGRLDFTGPTSDNLMEVDLNLYNNGQCKDKYKNVNQRKLSKGIVEAYQLCAGGADDEEKDTCQGDSGGPLVMKIGALFHIVGVTSFGKACGISNTPGVYTRVSAYVPWIEKVVWS